MIRLILARHGNTFEAGQTPVQVGAKTDLPLTAKGREQAEQLARRLLADQLMPKAIFAGKLKRQKESAEIVANLLGVAHVLEAPLAEIDYGPWEGLSADEIARRWPGEYVAWNERGEWPPFFGGSAEEHREKLDAWFAHLRKSYSENDIILGVGSNGLLRLIKNEKVKTGHFCELELAASLTIKSWDIKP